MLKTTGCDIGSVDVEAMAVEIHRDGARQLRNEKSHGLEKREVTVTCTLCESVTQNLRDGLRVRCANAVSSYHGYIPGLRGRISGVLPELCCRRNVSHVNH